MSKNLFDVTPVASQIPFDRLKSDNLTSLNLEDVVLELNVASKSANYLEFETSARQLLINHNFQQYPLVQVLEPSVAADAFSFEAFTQEAFAEPTYILMTDNEYIVKHPSKNQIQFIQPQGKAVKILMRA
jgi:membrane-bound lytic murein transglycosylase